MSAHEAHRRGRVGEDFAAREVVRRGGEVLARNVRLREVEFDLIARDATGYLFVEVKTRSGLVGGHPYEAVGDPKLHRMESGALRWLEDRGCGGSAFRFAIASILLAETGPPRLEWIELA